MLTRLVVRNFKKFDDVEIELGSPVVLVGPNNSGKSTALQALALWDIGLRRWNDKRGTSPAEKRPGVAINRRDLITVPVPDANLLWRDLHVRDVKRVNGKPETQNIRVEIIVDGITADKPWTCGLEFDYANEESIYCRPLRTSPEKDAAQDACASPGRQAANSVSSTHVRLGGYGAKVGAGSHQRADRRGADRADTP